MPTYEYGCKVCGKVIELANSNAHVLHCGTEARRIYSVGAIHLKGPGFYRNDKKFGR